MPDQNDPAVQDVPQATPAQQPPSLAALDDVALPGKLGRIVATHHPKLGHTKVDGGQFVRCMKTGQRDRTFKAGVCSLAIDSPYGFGAVTSSASEVAVSMALACDLGQERPMSALGALSEGHPLPQVDAKAWAGLSHAFAALRDRAPDGVTQYERLVFFETETTEYLITPILSLKWIHALNHRLGEKNARPSQEREASGNKTRKVPRGTLPVGGGQPQNVGYIVNKNTRNTRRGSIPVLMVRCPADHRTDLQRVFSRLGGGRSYLRVASIDREELLAYGRRAAMQVDLATHRQAEQRHARELADMFVALGEQLRPLIEEGAPLDQREGPWQSLPLDELKWLDPRLGQFDRATLANRFAREVKSRVERMLIHARQDQEARVPLFIMPDRSVDSLIAAFEEIL
ncbi:MAG: hypothetical protein HQL64_09595 [Magnetococcales bacterium]|nr:hypothetical protein [Magnetococcales bacterium]